jgi:hypothetical protein
MENLQINSNKSARTFTIRKLQNNKVYAKFRTYQFSKEEFKSADWFWTTNDWKNFLKTNDYYVVK